MHRPACYLIALLSTGPLTAQTLALNDLNYFEMPGVNVMVFHDYYPEGHQTGVTIIQNGVRLASNGDLRLEPAPGQWQPVPKVGKRVVDKEHLLLSVPLSYPNPDLNRKGFNPIIYPDLHFTYKVNVQAEGAAIRITVDLEEALPEAWIGKVGFNLELFPGNYFGKTFYMDEEPGIFPRQLNGPMTSDPGGDRQIVPLAEGKRLTIAPEVPANRMTISAQRGRLQLLDGRAHHNNGWFIVRTPVPAGATESAIDWVVTPNPLPDWQYEPVIHVSQVGYHPNQNKVAIIECDPKYKAEAVASLLRVFPSGELRTVYSARPERWGKFLRYQYLLFDFSKITESGIYIASYGDKKSLAFQIDEAVFERHVWQPTLEYFLPVQMCHMRVNDRYRVWHGLCHQDDALMAPVDTNHFDGYKQGPSTLTSFKPLEPVAGLNIGGWHDAGDYDLRVESQAGTIKILALAYEAFQVNYDETTIDQQKQLVELHRPDGKPDILQQIEHGALTIMAGYKNLGRLYRGIICNDLRQYVLLGDASTMTDNRRHNALLKPEETSGNESGIMDDRWVFTEQNPRRELQVAASLATVARALNDYNDALAKDCLAAAQELWQNNMHIEGEAPAKIATLAELILTTEEPQYKEALLGLMPQIEENIEWIGWLLGRVQPHMPDDKFDKPVTAAIRAYSKRIQEQVAETPFGVPYQPRIWGAGWDIQRFGVQQYYLHAGWPDIISKEPILSALNFILGVHPGKATKSFASGVGSNSLLVAYGTNRADWSYIPGGVGSGTAFIRPDFPELKEWPFFWQQTEYVIGGGGSNFMFLVLAANQLCGNAK